MRNKVKGLTLFGIVILFVSMLWVIPCQASTTVNITLDNSVYTHWFGAYMVELNNGELFTAIAGDKGSVSNTAIFTGNSTNNGVTWNTNLFMTCGTDWGFGGLALLYDSQVNRLFIFYAQDFYNGTLPDLVWNIYYVYSDDNGVTWTNPTEINTGHQYLNCVTSTGIQMQNGNLVMPFSYQQDGNSSYYIQSGMLLSSNHGVNWQVSNTIDFATSTGQGCDEPCVVEKIDGSLFALLRTTTGYQGQSTSTDGLTWTPVVNSPLVSPNAPACLLRVSFNPDVILAIWDNSASVRSPLVIASSNDSCQDWHTELSIDTGTCVCYPKVVNVSATNSVIVSYWNSNAGLDTFDNVNINLSEIPSSGNYIAPTIPIIPTVNPNQLQGGGGGVGGIAGSIPSDYTGKTVVPVKFDYDLGRVSLYIPANTICLDGLGNPNHCEPTFKNLRPQDTPSGNITEIAFDFQPDGATFTPNATITIKLSKTYDNPQDLRIVTYNGTSKQWEYLNTTYDARQNTLSACITHFSIYGVMMRFSPPQLEQTQSAWKALPEWWGNVLRNPSMVAQLVQKATRL